MTGLPTLSSPLLQAAAPAARPSRRARAPADPAECWCARQAYPCRRRGCCSCVALPPFCFAACVAASVASGSSLLAAARIGSHAFPGCTQGKHAPCSATNHAPWPAAVACPRRQRVAHLRRRECRAAPGGPAGLPAGLCQVGARRGRQCMQSFQVLVLLSPGGRAGERGGCRPPDGALLWVGGTLGRQSAPIAASTAVRARPRPICTQAEACRPGLLARRVRGCAPQLGSIPRVLAAAAGAQAAGR